MKKIIAIIFVLVSINIFGLEIKGIPETIKQGDFFVITLEKGLDEKNIEIKTKIAWTELKIFEYSGSIYTFVPVSYNVNPGKYLIEISYDVNEKKEHKSYTVEVTGKKVKMSKLKVSKKIESKNSKKNKTEMWNAVKVARSKSFEKLWKEEFIKPVEGQVLTDFAYERYVNGKSNGKHSGIDFRGRIGTEIKAVNDAVVVYSDYLKVTGNTIILDHGMNLFSSYSHLDKSNVKTGDKVKRGDIIGKVGNTGFSTGPHLHFTFTIGDTFINPWLIFEKKLIDK